MRIIAVGLVWFAFGLLIAWAWGRMKRNEKEMIPRYRRARLGDRPVECAELCPRFDDCYSVHDCLRDKNPGAYVEVD
jgi:hypothetical protein